MGKSKEPVQTGNVTYVVTSFNGVPCAVEAYKTERQALKRYENLKSIIREVAARQTGLPVSEITVIEAVREKSRIKTSRSGLPECVFANSNETLAVVRGPIYGEPRSVLPYVAVSENGALDVVCFEGAEEAQNAYQKIRDSHAGAASFEETDTHTFTKTCSTEDISVAVGIADVIPKGGK